MKPQTPDPKPPHPPAAASQPASPRAGSAVVRKEIDSRTLFANSDEVVITHGAETYRLRLTRQNRLILTK